METVDGKEYGVPSGFVPLSVIYNKTLFAAAGIDSFPTTWDEWVADAKKLTKSTRTATAPPSSTGSCCPTTQTVGNGIWPSLFAGNGGSITNDAARSPPSTPPRTSRRSSTGRRRCRRQDLADRCRRHRRRQALHRRQDRHGDRRPVDGRRRRGIEHRLRHRRDPGGPEGAGRLGHRHLARRHGPDRRREAGRGRGLPRATSTRRHVATKWALGSGWPPLRTDVTAADVDANPTVAALTGLPGTTIPLLPGVVEQHRRADRDRHRHAEGRWRAATPKCCSRTADARR